MFYDHYNYSHSGLRTNASVCPDIDTGRGLEVDTVSICTAQVERFKALLKILGDSSRSARCFSDMSQTNEHLCH